jgi:hypothetical protein
MSLNFGSCPEITDKASNLLNIILYNFFMDLNQLKSLFFLFDKNLVLESALSKIPSLLTSASPQRGLATHKEMATIT